MDALAEVAERWHLPMIEDVAEALGSRYKGRHVGYHGMVVGAELQRQQDRHHRRRRRDPDHRSRSRARGQAPDDDGEEAAPVGVPARSGRLQLPAAQHQCGARLRAARAARRLHRGQAAARARAMSRPSRDVPGASIFVDADYAESNYLAGDHDARYAPTTRARDDVPRNMPRARAALPAGLDRACTACRCISDCPRMELAEAEALEARIVNLPSSAVLGMRLERKASMIALRTPWSDRR